MTVQLSSVALDAADPAGLARFWAGLLGRDVTDGAGGPLLAGDEAQLGLRFVRAAGRAGRNRAHLHLTSADEDDQQHTVAAALALGARHADVGQPPEARYVVLADPEDNAFCVIEPGNRFLAGTGFLGELTCEGTRTVGRFWSRALGWPLVWDQDGETAVQSPHGGTKVSWGGEPVPPAGVRNRHRLELAAPGGDLAAETERLLSLGATRLEPAGPTRDAVLADPDGNAFRLAAG